MPRLLTVPVLVMILGSCWTSPSFAQSSASNFLDYQGERIELARTYANFDEYKDDVGNLSPKQASRVEALMRRGRLGPSFTNAEALDEALFKLQFPGYGMFYANQLGTHIDPLLELASVEIPLKGQNRYFVLERMPKGGFRVIADFVSSSNPEITRVRRAKTGKLEFRNSNGTEIIPK
jgi:hypothetical protein